MTGKKVIMNAIKRAVSPAKLRAASTDSLISAAENASLTAVDLDRLEGPSKQLFAMSFAAQMSIDKHALVFDLANALPWLGINRIDSALRLLTRHLKRDEYKTEKVFHTGGGKLRQGWQTRQSALDLVRYLRRSVDLFHPVFKKPLTPLTPLPFLHLTHEKSERRGGKRNTDGEGFLKGFPLLPP